MNRFEQEMQDLVGIDKYGQPIIRELCPKCQEKHVIPGDCAGLRILPADEPAKKEERDFFGVVYCALATIGAMAIFYWGARAIQLLVRWAR